MIALQGDEVSSAVYFPRGRRGKGQSQVSTQLPGKKSQARVFPLDRQFYQGERPRARFSSLEHCKKREPSVSLGRDDGFQARTSYRGTSSAGQAVLPVEGRLACSRPIPAQPRLRRRLSKVARGRALARAFSAHSKDRTTSLPSRCYLVDPASSHMLV